MFQYKTRGNASPQGKQKVYFTCHPDDFDRYFEKISEQILTFENCAVWYWDSEESYRDIATELGGMSCDNETADNAQPRHGYSTSFYTKKSYPCPPVNAGRRGG